MYNLDDTAIAALRSYGLARHMPVYLSTKNTILKAYLTFKDLFAEIFAAEFKAEYDKRGLTYEHRLIDDILGGGVPENARGGYVWACKNYDGDVQSDTRPGLRVRSRPTTSAVHDAGRQRAPCAHGTVTRHFRQHQHGRATLRRCPRGAAHIAPSLTAMPILRASPIRSSAWRSTLSRRGS